MDHAGLQSSCTNVLILDVFKAVQAINASKPWRAEGSEEFRRFSASLDFPNQ